MKEYGQVVGIKKNFAQVRIGRNSACASCGKCGMTENQKHVDFYTENTLNAQIGDRVEVEIHDNANTTGMAFVAYILPLIPALVALFVALAYLNDVWAIALFFVGYALGFTIVALIDKAKKHKWMQSPTMLKIISKINGDNNVAKENNNE